MALCSAFTRRSHLEKHIVPAQHAQTPESLAGGSTEHRTCSVGFVEPSEVARAVSAYGHAIIAKGKSPLFHRPQTHPPFDPVFLSMSLGVACCPREGLKEQGPTLQKETSRRRCRHHGKECPHQNGARHSAAHVDHLRSVDVSSGVSRPALEKE